MCYPNLMNRLKYATCNYSFRTLNVLLMLLAFSGFSFADEVTKQEIIIIDESVDDRKVFYHDLKPGLIIHEINSKENGLEQLSSILQEYEKIEALHIISHANDGEIQLGNSLITRQTLQGKSKQLQQLNKSFLAGADVLFYGCNLASSKNGEDLLSFISAEMGVDIAASANFTGNDKLNGDWTLEYQLGSIESALPFNAELLKTYSHVLAAPVLSNLDGESVAWDGVGNSVNLDSSGNATVNDSEFDALNGGLGDYNGATLTIKRSVSAISADVFTFDTSGALFTVNGDNLELSGQTFASFTNASGQLTIVFNSATTIATTVLVQDVLQHILYLNNTPAGDAIIRFSLHDGVSATDADVTVTSDSIYVTNTTDTAVVDLSNGVSYSEAVAIALADVSGSQTLVFAPTLASMTLIINSVSISESLIFDVDLANGLLITGAAITLDTGVTLTFSNGGADNVTVNGMISGSGGLTKVGTGTLTLGSANTATGNVTVAAGSLSLINGAALENTVAVTVNAGASLIIDNNEIIGSLAGAGNAVLSGALTLGSNNSSTTLSGVISGTGSLTKLGTGTLTLSGNNTYSGLTVISGGGLNVTGTLENTSAMTVNSLGVVSGTGSVFAVGSTNSINFIAGSTLSPGVAGPGLLTINGNLTMASNSTLAVDINGTTSGAEHDAVAVNGIVTVTGVNLVATHGYTSTLGDAYSILTNDGVDAINGNFSGLAEGGTQVANGNSTVLKAHYGATDGGATTGGNEFMLVAPVTVTVSSAPSIGIATAGNTQASVSFSAPANNGGTAITGYTVTSSPDAHSVYGTSSPLPVMGLTNGVAYTFTVRATNSVGTSAASGASNSITPGAAQTITFNNPGAQSFGATPTLTATASSSLTPNFTSSTTSVCTVTVGGSLTFLTAGTCTINANQAGNGSYVAASTVSQSFTVNAVVPGVPTAATATAGDTQASVSFSAPTNNGGAAITGYTVTSNPGGFTASGISSPLTMVGLTNGTAYSFTVTATNSQGTSASSVASNVVTPTIPKTSQTISFSNPGTKTMGTSASLSASASSGLTPVFSSLTSGICKVSGGGVLTLVSAGTCTITASQAGNGTYYAASSVNRSFQIVSVVPGAPTIGRASVIEKQVSVSFSAPANSASSGAIVYTVTSNPAGITATGASSPITVTGLSNSTAYSFTVTAKNSVGTSAPSKASNIVSLNEAPVTNNSTVTVDEDSSLIIELIAVDADNDTLTFEIITQPESGTLEHHGNAWLYTPKQDFNGVDQVSFIAKDDELSSNVAIVTMNVTPVNDDPIAVEDTYTLTNTENDVYILTVLDNDVDVDEDILIIDGAAADIGNVKVSNDSLSYTAPKGYRGPVALRYTINDGNKGYAAAKINLIIEGGDTENMPVITVPDDVETNATGLFTRVKLGFAKAVDYKGQPVAVTLLNQGVFFAPGNQLVYWQAIDSEGNTAIQAQKVKVHPLISLSKNQIVSEGNGVVVSVHLNGVAPVYPLSIPYTISGTANGNDHDLVDGVVEIVAGQQATIHFTTFEDAEIELDENVIITLDPSVNVNSNAQIEVVISERNIAPMVNIVASQAGEQRFFVTPNGGDVQLTVDMSDANIADSLTSEWESGVLVLQSDDMNMFFSPVDVLPGIYPISLTVTDNGVPELSTTEQVSIIVRSSLPALTRDDSDGDLIPDNQEGYTDKNRDGIPDYLDAINDCSIMPSLQLQSAEFLVEVEAGLCLRLGQIALEQGDSAVQLEASLLPVDTIAINVGGVFDFQAIGLPQAGQSINVVLPQKVPMPANAVYRKYREQTGWIDFELDAKNTISSSPGDRGFCPSPGSNAWTQGLTEGHWCVQLTIEDGGPNDDDGLVNSAIVDPGGVSVLTIGNHIPVALPDTVSLARNQNQDVDVLANDTDSDGDTLTVIQVTSEFGEAIILDDQQINYTPAADFIGTDVLIYSISDGNGGTASSELTVIVSANSAPIAVNDSANTDDRTSLLLDVVSNDNDPDDNAISLISVTAEQGEVSIESNKLRYIPQAGFNGVDTVSYQISDGLDGLATAQVVITIKAYQEVIVKNKSSGGGIGLWATMMLFIIMLRRKLLLSAL